MLTHPRYAQLPHSLAVVGESPSKDIINSKLRDARISRTGESGAGPSAGVVILPKSRRLLHQIRVPEIYRVQDIRPLGSQLQILSLANTKGSVQSHICRNESGTANHAGAQVP